MYALIDCNNFFASCEQLFNPKLQGKPLVILSNNDGCVIARSPEAKKLGIPMGAPAFEYRSLFLEYSVSILSSNFAFYGDMSKRVMDTLKTFEFPVEIYSIDEAFLFLPEADPKLGHLIRDKVMQWTGIPISIGIAPTKTLAKVANKLAKNGPGVVSFPSAKAADSLLRTFSVEDIWGIGRHHKKRLYSYGVRTAADLKKRSDAWVKRYMSVTGLRTVWELQGIPCLSCQEMQTERKSIVSSRSFGRKITDHALLKEALSTFLAHATRKLRRSQLKAQFLVVFITSDTTTSAAKHLPLSTAYTPDLSAHAHALLDEIFMQGKEYKRAGVMLGELVDENATQFDLFAVDPKSDRKQAVMTALDTVNRRFETPMLSFASEGIVKKWQGMQAHRSPLYTTSWDEIPKC
ncbi:Y-family DNA polymerase [Simkania negevensis]|uniref:Protein umuC n=1 Tax=Simkania negevensis (strain ATCC VR-1471 / DSM 27360 / Z) TaxID=331113 RepID=F8L8Q2_SIMNZ|nr:Y-family DNA polymerase [Simkania negevensis]CCB89195.1 protein umuC [Simkania negevensis Z]